MVFFQNLLLSYANPLSLPVQKDVETKCSACQLELTKCTKLIKLQQKIQLQLMLKTTQAC